MDKAVNTELFTQVRVAHRLLAAYYQRVHHLLEEVSNHEAFGLEFYSWGPAWFNRPALRTTNTLNKWSWDLLPGVMTDYLFLNGDEKSQKPGDWLLWFHVVSDTAIRDTDISENPLEITTAPENSHSVLRCYITAPRVSLSFDWYHEIWNVTDYPECTVEPESQCIDDENEIYAAGFEVPMELLTADDSVQMLVEKIEKFRKAAISGSA